MKEPTSAQAESAPSADRKYTVKGRDYPFIPSKEYIDPETGKFYTIAKVQVIHMMACSRLDGLEHLLALMKLCIRVDGEELTDTALVEMEFKLHKKLVEILTSQL